MAVARAAPFEDPSYEVAWQGKRAAVWYWSASRITALVGTLGRRDRVVAEAPRLGHPRDQGCELLALPHGYEGRLWHEGALFASRWWAAPPSELEWSAFVRGAGFDATELTTPEASTAARHAKRWPSKESGGLKSIVEEAGALIPQGKQIGANLLVMAFGWHLGSALHSRWDLYTAQSRIAELTSSLEPILSARAEADRNREAIDELLSLRSPAPQLTLLAEASRLMEGSGWRVILWTQPNENTVVVRFNATQMDGETIVSKWESSPWFESVTPSLDQQGTNMTIQARLTPDGSRPSGTPAPGSEE